MEERVLGGKYKVIDVLESNDYQNIYLTEDITLNNAQKLIVNEIKHKDYVNDFSSYFNATNINLPDNFVESFDINHSYYVIGKLCKGKNLYDFLNNNSLRLSDKMYISDNLLSSLSKLDTTHAKLKFLLSNPDCISIFARKKICFNMNFIIDKNVLEVSENDTLVQVSNILCSIFSNTPGATLEKDRDNIPPSMINLISKCSDGTYKSFKEIYKVFQSTLLYSTFIENESIDKQIMRNINKAKRKKSILAIRNVTIIVILILLSFGFWWSSSTGFFDRTIPSSGIINEDNEHTTNNKPVANFTPSISKVYAGDEVFFVSRATDSDINDEVSTYKWTIIKGKGIKELFSTEANTSYTFNEEGGYIISLVVKDKSGLESDEYSLNVNVLAEQNIPPSTGTSTQEGDVK